MSGEERWQRADQRFAGIDRGSDQRPHFREGDIMTTMQKQKRFNAGSPHSMKAIRRCLAAVLLIVSFTGCAGLSSAPMEVLRYTNPDMAAPHQRMFIFLRGIGGGHQCFEEEGLVADVRACGLPYDMAAPNAHVGYYVDRSLIIRLKADVIDPAKARGVAKIWLVGVSMGGLGAMLYLYEHPEDVAGVYLMAPFLGPQYLLEEIEAAGGVRKWQPGVYNAEEDWQRMLWHWIQQTIADHPDKIIYLGYGVDDPYRLAAQLLAPVLPPGRVYAVDGGHDYATFKALWKIFLTNDTELRK